MRVFRRPYQQFALWLAVAAVLLRAMIPDGFMFERQAGERGLSLVFCYAGPLAALRGSDGAMAHMHHHHGAMGGGPAQHDPAHHHDSGQASCPFAAAAAPGPPVAALPSFGFPPAGSGPPAAVRDGVLAAAARLRPPARAPPILA